MGPLPQISRLLELLAVAKQQQILADLFSPSAVGTATFAKTFCDWHLVESIMKTSEGWRRHLQELVNASFDPMVCALRWAQDPRCLQRGATDRRVGAFAAVRSPVCRLSSAPSFRKW